jgi:REP element-mobilizing transposase RayT
MCFLGDVVKGKMILSKIGEIADKFWKEIPQHFDNAQLDEFIVMPNHIHGILVIVEKNRKNNKYRDEALPRLYKGDFPQMAKISPKPKSLPVIVGSYKSIFKRICAKEHAKIGFEWQTRYYDHIIRNKEELQRIREYIINNPLKWDEDKNNIENLWM